jgi:ADP-heptose:LPS heptosyltransferase
MGVSAACHLFRWESRFLAGCERLFWNRRVPHAPAKILIYRIGNIGDILCAIPAMIAVRETFPDAHITLLTSPGQKGMPEAEHLLAGAWFIDRLWTYYADDITSLRSQLALMKEVRKERFELWVELPINRAGLKRIMRDMFFAKGAGVRNALGFEIGPSRSNKLMDLFDKLCPNEVERLLMILAKHGIKTEEVRFDLPISDKERKKCDEMVETLGIPVLRRWAGLCPGSKQPATRWSTDNFIAVGKYLATRGFSVLIFGGPGEEDIAEYVSRGIGAASFNLAGKTSILESAELIKKCDVLVTNDTGVMHLAAAVGTQCVAVFSSHNYAGEWHPWGEGHVVLRGEADCGPCFLMECPKDNLCINSITPDKVIASINKLLSQQLSYAKRKTIE